MRAFCQELPAALLVDHVADRIGEMRQCWIGIGGCWQAHGVEPIGPTAAAAGQRGIEAGGAVVLLLGRHAGDVRPAIEKAADQRAVLGQHQPVIDQRRIGQQIGKARLSGMEGLQRQHQRAPRAGRERGG